MDSRFVLQEKVVQVHMVVPQEISISNCKFNHMIYLTESIKTWYTSYLLILHRHH